MWHRSEVTGLSDLKEECYRDVARGKLELMAGVQTADGRPVGGGCQAGHRLKRAALKPRC